MDAVMFDVKQAHLALQRVGRLYTQPYGMTAARFDLMNALYSENGMVQASLWKLLGVTRSVICEMLGALLEKQWVKRVKAADSRTWFVTLTAKGREIFERVFKAHVDNGDVATTMERGLSRQGAVDHTLPVRETLLWHCDGIIEAYRTRPPAYGVSLYMGVEDYWAWITTPEDGTWGPVPFVTDIDWEARGGAEEIEPTADILQYVRKPPARQPDDWD